MMVSKLPVFLFFFLVCLFTGCGAVISEQEAEFVARTELEDYSRREEVYFYDFSNKKISSVLGGWFFEYESKRPPKHLVTILVYYNRQVEVSIMIDTE